MDLTFRGRFDLKLDPKGRVTMPTVLRENLKSKERLVATNGLANGRPCIDIYTFKAWSALEKRIQRLPQLDRSVQAFQRFYLAGGLVTEMDSQGRLLLPQIHREHAQLTSDVVGVGMGEKLELWDHQLWIKTSEELTSKFEEVLAGVAHLEKKGL